MMNCEEVRHRISDITVWNSGDQRAPHQNNYLINVQHANFTDLDDSQWLRNVRPLP